MRAIPGIPLGEALPPRTWLFIVVALALALAGAGPMSVRQKAVGFFAERGFDGATMCSRQLDSKEN
jgi:hypothetical protein